MNLRQTCDSPLEFLFSNRAAWYFAIIGIVVASVLIFFVPDSFYPTSYVRVVFGLLLVLWLPGFSLLKVLYPLGVQSKKASESLDTVEQVVLSIGLSVIVASVVGLILNYTPWGIRLAPVTFSLAAVTVAFATLGVRQEYEKQKHPVL